MTSRDILLILQVAGMLMRGLKSVMVIKSFLAKNHAQIFQSELFPKLRVHVFWFCFLGCFVVFFFHESHKMHNYVSPRVTVG